MLHFSDYRPISPSLILLRRQSGYFHNIDCLDCHHQSNLGWNISIYSIMNTERHLACSQILWRLCNCPVNIECAGPEGFVRGVQLWLRFFLIDEGKEDQNTTTSGLSSARQRNDIMARWLADDGQALHAGLVALWFFRGSRPVLLRNPIFLRFFRRDLDPLSPPLDPRVSINWRLKKTACIYEGTTSTALNIFFQKTIFSF